MFFFPIQLLHDYIPLLPFFIPLLQSSIPLVHENIPLLHYFFQLLHENIPKLQNHQAPATSTQPPLQQVVADSRLRSLQTKWRVFQANEEASRQSKGGATWWKGPQLVAKPPSWVSSGGAVGKFLLYEPEHQNLSIILQMESSLSQTPEYLRDTFHIKFSGI